MSELMQQAKNVYQWSALQTGEAKAFNETEYYLSEAFNRALVRLKNTESILLGITGLQGTGKTSALNGLEHYLAAILPNGQKCVRLKWSREWRQQLISRFVLTDENYYYRQLEELMQQCPEKTKEIGVSLETLRQFLNQHRQLQRSINMENDEAKREGLCKDLDRIEGELDVPNDYPSVESLLGNKRLQNLNERLLSQFLRSVAYIIVDMQDYVKTDVRAMSKDLDELQAMWDSLMRWGLKVSFVVAIQKEIAMRRPHFFFGKFSMIELKPLTPQQLLEAYRLKWKTTDPFDKASLLLLAKLSRGVFRRFLKYINLTLEKVLVERQDFPVNSNDTIETSDVESAISFEVLSDDMQLEFADIFTQQAHKLQATKILQLARVQALTQKQIADELNISESTVTKLVGKLELYSYIKRNRGEGKSWLVSLA